MKLLTCHTIFLIYLQLTLFSADKTNIYEKTIFTQPFYVKIDKDKYQVGTYELMPMATLEEIKECRKSPDPYAAMRKKNIEKRKNYNPNALLLKGIYISNSDLPKSSIGRQPLVFRDINYKEKESTKQYLSPIPSSWVIKNITLELSLGKIQSSEKYLIGICPTPCVPMLFYAFKGVYVKKEQLKNKINMIDLFQKNVRVIFVDIPPIYVEALKNINATFRLQKEIADKALLTALNKYKIHVDGKEEKLTENDVRAVCVIRSIKDDKIIDFQELENNINDIPENITPKIKDELIDNLGKLLLDKKNFKFKNIPMTSVTTPEIMLRWGIINAFIRLKSKNALKYLTEFYIINRGDKGYYNLKDAILKLGGKIPALPKGHHKANQKNNKSETFSKALSEREKEEIQKVQKMIQSDKIYKRGKLAEAIEVLSKYKIRSENKRIIDILQSGKAGVADMEYCWQHMKCIGGDEILEYAKSTLLKPVPANADLKADDEHEAIVRTAAVQILSKYACTTKKDLEFLEKLLKKKDYQCVHDSCRLAINTLKEKLAKK